MGKPSGRTERIGKESSWDAGHSEKGHVMTGADYVEWTIAALPFAGMSTIPVVVNLAVTGWDLSRVSWIAWALSAWLLIASVMGTWEAIADSDRPSREPRREDPTRM
jgi:hypothetical protein